MIENLLDKYSLKKLTLLNLIYRHSSIKADTLAEELTLSIRSINRYVNELNDEIESLFDRKELIHPDGLTYYKISSNYDNAEVLDVFYKLKLHYLKLSSSFQLLVKLGTQDRISLFNLTEELALSSSYLFRIMKTTSTQLKSFSLKISVDKYNRVFLDGEEKSIRIFLFLFLTDSFQTIEWPFHHITKTNAEKMFSCDISETNFVQRNLFAFLVAILTMRLSKQNFIGNPNDYAKEILTTLFLKTKNNNHPCLSQFPLSSEQLKIEALYYNYMIHIFIPDSIALEKKLLVAKSLSNLDHEVIRFSKSLINDIEKEKNGSLTQNEKNLELYHHVLFYSLLMDWNQKLYVLQKLSFPKINYNLNLNNHEMERIIQLYNENLQTHSVSPLFKTFLSKEDNLSYAYSLSYNFSQSLNTPKIRINIQIVKDYNAKSYIERRLASLFNSNNIVFTTDLSETDLLISDLVEIDVTIPIFFIYNLQSRLEWDKLTELIQRLLLDQLFSSE